VDGKRIRVLVVDDDTFVQQSLTTFIRSTADLECVGCCSDGQQAVDFIGGHPVDVVVMDVQMPVVDGVEAARLILTDFPDVRVLLWTSFDYDEAVTKALSFGAAGFLVKACSVRTLLDSIRTVYGGMTVIAPDPLKKVTHGTPVPPKSAPPELSARERQVLAELCRGLSNSEIARHLYLSESSVKAHIASLMEKFEVRTRVKVVIRAHEFGLL